MGRGLLSDSSARASGRVAKNSARGRRPSALCINYYLITRRGLWINNHTPRIQWSGRDWGPGLETRIPSVDTVVSVIEWIT